MPAGWAERARLRREVDLAMAEARPWRVNGTLTFTVVGHRFSVTSTGDVGCDSKRPRYFVGCGTCGSVLHENTTGAETRIVGHLLDAQ